MFLDIRGFTTPAESMKGEEAFQRLQALFAELVRLLQRITGSSISIWDGLLAIFDREGEFQNDVLKCIQQIATIADCANQSLLPVRISRRR